MIRKILLITLSILCLIGCSKQKNLVTVHDYIDDESITVLRNDNLPVSLLCFLGSGVTKTINDLDTMNLIFDMLQEVELDINSTVDDLQIDDGSIGFIFYLQDGSELKYYFCTSEYYHDKKFITVNNPNLVNDICDIARYADENIDRKISQLKCEKGIIEVEYVDNGDEAPNLIVLKPSWNKQEIFLEAAYSIEEIDEIENGLEIVCKVGDYYMHDTLRKYHLIIDGKELKTEVLD